MSKSNFELALENFGFNTIEKQEALLRIFSFAGYFKDISVWQDSLHLVKDDDATHSRATNVWRKIFTGIKASHADEVGKCNLNILLDNFKQYDSSFDVKFWEDYLLYTCQHAFARAVGIERYQICSKEWMKTYATEYLEAAKAIGLIDRVNPTREEYDEAWIAGASRIGMLARFIDFEQLLNSGLKVAHTLALVGARPAWANIDGIPPDVLEKLNGAHRDKINMDVVNVSLLVGEEAARIKEGKEYLSSLAKKEEIRLNEDQPFIQYQTQAECPEGLFPNRWYPNYAEGETRKITETVIARDLLEQYIPITSISLCDTAAENGARPTTVTTSYDAAKALLSTLDTESIGHAATIRHVLLFSNNPYIERQRLAAQEQANKAAREFNEDHHTSINIRVDGAGFGAKQDVATVHSELAALFAEEWKKLHPSEKGDNLFYQTRNHDFIDIPCPELDLAGESSGI